MPQYLLGIDAGTSVIKAAIFGASGSGKTSLLWTLLATTTLVWDLEAGDLLDFGQDGHGDGGGVDTPA